MLSIALVNEKPGTGKTTSAVLLTAALHQLGRHVLLVDADPGSSAQHWNELTDTGFPWAVVGMATKTIYHDLRTMTRRAHWDTVVIDCPQVEDHASISRPALRYARHWVIPFAPSGIELDRTPGIARVLDEVQAVDDTEHLRWVLLNRTNRRARSRTGKDARTAAIMTEHGYRVFPENVHFSDRLYREPWGYVPDVSDTPFPAIAAQLLEVDARHAAA